MSFWQRLFGRGPEAGAPAVTSLAQQYQKKYQNFSAIMAEGEAARDILEQLRLQMVENQDVDFSKCTSKAVSCCSTFARPWT